MTDADDLPDGWAVATFDDLFLNVTSSLLKLPQSKYADSGTYPVIDQGQLEVGGYTDDASLLHPVLPPLIVFGDHTKCVKLLQTQFVQGADGVKVIQPKGAVLADFAYWMLKAIELPDKGYARHFGFLRSFEFALPPLAEQRRIVAKVEELTARSRAARAALAEVPTLLEQFRQSVLASAFRGDLTADWRAKNPGSEPASVLLERIRTERRKQWEAKYPKKKYVAPDPVDDIELPELPEGWCWATVEELSTKVSDGVHKKPTYVSSGIPFVTVKNLTRGPGISFDDLNYISQSDHEEFCRRTHPERGDILISKDGATLGRVRLIETDRVFSIFVSVALIKLVEHSLGPYLVYAMSEPAAQHRMVKTGTGIQHIHLQDLRALCLPIPPTAEQAAILGVIKRAMSSVASLTEEAKATQLDLAHLDQSILAKAFRGELVPQDPADEPAAVLLTRTRSGGGATTPTTPTRSAKRGQVKFYILLLLRTWSKPLGREMLERGLVLMLNADVRRAILGRSKPAAKPTKKRGTPPRFVNGMDAVLGEMIDDRWLVPGPEASFFAEGQHGIDFTAAPPSDLDAVRETAEAMKVLHKDKQQATDADIVSALNGEIYELVS